MLLKSKISEHSLSLDPTLNEAYKKAKLSLFTSSEFHYLMAEKGLGSAGRNYIYRKAGEAMLNLETDDKALLEKIKEYLKHKQDLSTIATEHGLNYEREGLQLFGEKMGLSHLLVQRLILDEDGRCGGTPDGLIVLNESTDGLSYNVQTCEIKCPISFDAYIRLFKCKTPDDLKKEERAYYFQVLHQMEICGALDGYFIVYHPFFKSGKMNIIKFNKVEIVRNVKIGEKNDFKIMAERKAEAIQIFNETINQLTNDTTTTNTNHP